MNKEIIIYIFCCVCVCVSFCRILLVNNVNSKVFGFVLQHLSGDISKTRSLLTNAIFEKYIGC
jgi:hypothetical protein